MDKQLSYKHTHRRRHTTKSITVATGPAYVCHLRPSRHSLAMSEHKYSRFVSFARRSIYKLKLVERRKWLQKNEMRCGRVAKRTLSSGLADEADLQNAP